ncbi:hypothetical protein TSUD_28830 [Trifolium subterraneum]|uniref:F-box domain-containing protein n=1 Tax=Trifolium subterraneum TaxID=3900 RepID=A0A2Z6PIN7_TRISU|nr:hypothetical protein TSUD_28830 [Trifolium subterraneum]
MLASFCKNKFKQDVGPDAVACGYNICHAALVLASECSSSLSEPLTHQSDSTFLYFPAFLQGFVWKTILVPTISSLEVGGFSVEGVAPIRKAVVSHFASHFKAVNVVRPGVDSLTFKRLHPAEVGSLIKPFSLEEVKAAVWDCDSFKSPGPDGVNFGLIKDFWSEMQVDVMSFIAEFHRNDRLTKGINATFIALIPKVESPQRLNDFMSISLVGNLYKILVKVLANRLRLVMGRVISESQMAFVRDRQILDGILIANEVVDEARWAKKELMLFKVDFEKAYDSVDWGYLDVVMGRMGFPTLWRKWIKECVCTATASVLVNGSPTDEFPLERGLRQGDPLSPLLFLLVAKGLHVLMEAMEAHNLFSGYMVGKSVSISVTHLQFADDTLLMGTKSWANVRALRVVLLLFETMSGLKVNFNKGMLVGVNIPDSWLGKAASALGCRVGKIPFLYLGLPIGGDPRRLRFWKPVLTRLKKRLSGWKSRFLTFGGRKYLGSIGKLFAYKRHGGLGVRQLREFNLALLGKWCWRLLVDIEGLWFRVLAVRYGVERGRLCAGGMRGSSWWREVTRIRDGGGEVEGGWFGGHISRQVASTVEGVGGGDVGGVPLKVSILAWRLLRDRLPTKANLISRGILPVGDSHCVSGCGSVESAHHVFISCSMFGSLWSLVSSWVGSATVTAQTLSDHFVQFTISAGGTRARRSFMQLIWLACVTSHKHMAEIQDLPEDCIADILSRTTPVDTCRFSVISKTFRSAADSDVVWNRFLPSNSNLIDSIISRSPSLTNIPTKKALYLALSDRPVIMGHDSLKLLSFVNRDVCWLEIRGMIKTIVLSPNTQYAAYVVFKLIESRGFQDGPVELSVVAEGGHSRTRDVCLDPNVEGMLHPRVEGLQRPSVRTDGWLEIEMGELFNPSIENEEVQMNLMEIQSNWWKSGLLLEGIEVRPKIEKTNLESKEETTIAA